MIVLSAKPVLSIGSSVKYFNVYISYQNYAFSDIGYEHLIGFL